VSEGLQRSGSDQFQMTALFLELGIAALSAALPVGMACQKYAVATSGTDRLLGLDGVAGQLVIPGDALDLALLGCFLGCHLACPRCSLFGLDKGVALNDVGSLNLLCPLCSLIDLGVANGLALSKFGLQAIHIYQADL